MNFLEVLISKRDDGYFSHQDFQKKNLIEQYLHANSHNFPTQNLCVLNTSDTRVFSVSDENHLKYEKINFINFLY